MAEKEKRFLKNQNTTLSCCGSVEPCYSRDLYITVYNVEPCYSRDLYITRITVILSYFQPKYCYTE